MSNCKIFRNKDNSINKVMDEFGNESQLYYDTLFHVSTLVDNMPMTPPVKHYLDKGDIMDNSVSEVALGLWAYSYSKHFRDKYNITKSNLDEVSVDDIIRHIEEYYPKPIAVTQTVVQQGFKEFIDSIVIPEQRVTDEMLNSIQSINATENTIRDLAARMANRIGMSVRFESDITKDYKGKIVNNTAIINLAYATLDTPIHEILGHPIIRAIKNKNKGFVSSGDYIVDKNNNEFKVKKVNEDYDFVLDNGKVVSSSEYFLSEKSKNSQLYQNLLKELETGRGKEVLDRIKRDYDVRDTSGFYIKPYEENGVIIGYNISNTLKQSSTFFRDLNEAEDFLKTKQTLQKYTLEEQQEEAIVELLGLYTANRLDSVKDGKFISLLKKLLKEIKSFIRQLLNQKEIEITKLPDNITISDLANLLAYSNSKIILPGNEVTYTTPDNEQFNTYVEASNHISKLVKNIEEIDLSNVDFYLSNQLKNLGLNYDFSDLDKVDSFVDLRTGTTIYKEVDNWVVDLEGETEFYNENGYYPTKIIDDIEAVYLYNEYKEYEEAVKNNLSTDIVLPISLEDLKKQSNKNFIKQFIEKNKQYEQSKEIIEEWKEVNNIVYNPEEVYSRGQGFYHAVGAYEGLELELLLQNLVNNLEIVEKAGGSYNVSAFTKPIGNTIEHLEKSAINFVIYPESKDILHAASTDTYTGSMKDFKGNYAVEFFNVKGQKELYPIIFSKYPILRNIDEIQPNLANIIDNLSHNHNELGITLRGNNFRVELNTKKLNTVYDDSKYYGIKKIVDNINSILDQKYGKLVKPKIKKLKKLTIQEENELESLKYLKTESLKLSLLDFLSPSDLFSKKDQDRLNELQQGELVTKYTVASIDPADNITYKTFENEEDAIAYKEYLDTNNPYVDSDIVINKSLLGVKPIQTKDTLVESIKSIKNKVTNEYKLTLEPITKEQYDNAVKSNDVIGEFTEDGEIYYVDVTDTLRYRRDNTGYYAEKNDKISKEYTEQALINTKIVKLKEVAKKYPRSLIRSEVIPINRFNSISLFDKSSDLPFQKVPTYNPDLINKIYYDFATALNINQKNETKDKIILKEYEKIKENDKYVLLDEELNSILKMPDGYIDEKLNKFKTIAKIIKDKLKSFPIKVYYKEDEKEDGILGLYVEYYQTIIMYDNINITSKISTLLHEATHALTLGTIYDSEFGVTDRKFDNLLNSYREIVSKEVNKKGYIGFDYQLSNNKEFLAAVFSEYEFRDILKSIPSTKTDNKTLWDDILDLIKELIGIDGKDTLLEDVINDTLTNLENFETKKIVKLIKPEQKKQALDLYSQYLKQNPSKDDIFGFRNFVEKNVLLPQTPTYNPETKSKTALLEEFNRLIEVTEKMGTTYPKDAINKIKSFLQELNFDLSTVKEILDKRGLNDNPKAVIDFAYNTIAFGEGATVEDFAEEIGHLITLHAPQNKDLNLALEAIKDTQLYKDNYLNYVKTYSKPGLALEMTPERKAALEVLGRFYGKLLTGTLTENDMKISKQSFFKKIMNFVRRMINKTDNFNLRNYLEKNRDNFFLEPGKEIKSKEIFYSLEQSENIAYDKMINAIDNMVTSMKSRMSREVKDTTAPLGEYSKRQANLQTQLASLYQMKGNIAYDTAIADFLKSLYVDSANIFSFLEKYFDVRKSREEITLKDIKFNKSEKILIGDTIVENTSTNIKFDMFRLGRLKEDADLSTLHYSQLSELREFLIHYESFIKELGIDNRTNNTLTDSNLFDLDKLFNYVNTSLSSINIALNTLSAKKMPDAIENLIDDTGVDMSNIPKDILDALKDTNIKGDVGMMEYLMGTTRDSSQPILRLFNATVKNIMHIAKRNTLSFAGKFLDKLNHRMGQSMDWAYEKFNDKFTGYLISEYNYGRFKMEKDSFFKDLNLRYEYPTDFASKENMGNKIVTRFVNNDKAKLELKALKVSLNKESDSSKRIQYQEQIDTLNTLINNVEYDYSKLRSYQKETNDWFRDNTTELENVEEIIQFVIDDTELSSTEKAVWLNNNVNKNDDGDIIGYKNELVRPSNKYLNSDYKKLSSADIADLNYIKETKKELDKFLPTKMNKLAPQTYQSAMDTFMKTQLPELVDKIKFLGKSAVTKQEDDEIGELVGDRINYEDETRIIKYNPTRYTKLLLEPNNISTDLLSSMIAYAKMVSEFKEKSDRIEQLEFIAQNIKNGYTTNTDTNMSSPSSTSNLVKQLENYLRVQIMGITYPDVTIPVLNIKPTKLLKNFARFVSLKNLGLNYVTQLVDGVTSTIWYNIEKTMGDTVTRKSSALGYAAFKELAQDSIKESSSTIKNNKLSAILRTLGLSDNLHSVFNDLDKNILMRDASNKILFAGYRSSNFLISGNAALSGMYNFRLYNGKWYTEKEFSKIENPTEQFDSLPSAYDNMRVENGLMTIDGMNTKTLNLFTRRMNNLISKIDGKLSEEDKTYAHNTLIGIVTLIHRDWILDGISRRLKKRGFNFDTSAVDEGYWVSTARFMKDFFMEKEKVRNLKFLVDNYNALNDVEKEGVRRTMKELMVIVGSIALAIILNLGDDDDDRELDYVRDFLAYLSTRSTVELTAFYNPFEYLYAATDVFVIGRDLKRIMSFSEMFDAREIESGKWEGWTRSQKYFLQNIPGVNGILSGTNPEASNRFIINNVLGFAGGLDKLKYYRVPLIGSIDDQDLLEIEREER